MEFPQLTSEEKDRISKFFGTLEWRILEGFFQRLLDDVNKVSDIDPKSDNIAGEVTARQVLHGKLTQFLKDLEFFKTAVPRQPRRDTSE